MASKFSYESGDAKNEFHDNYIIEGLWILERSSGLCIFERMYENIINSEVSRDLICGFFSAISNISRLSFSDDIQYIKLYKKKIVFESSNDLIFVLIVREDLLTDYQVKNIAIKISKKFNSLFHFNYECWNGDIEKYDKFTEVVDSIVKEIPFYSYYN